MNGLGGPYYDCSRTPWNMDERSLTYFKKGKEEWGTKFILAVEGELEFLNISVSPNPANGVLKIALPKFFNRAAIQIQDIAGKSIITEMLVSKENNLDISSLKGGVYFCKVTSNEKYSNLAS